ncbi:hypothetical protein ACERII_15840 [Evansella sp. AB-rgal1]|uniref:hypothetical protein n=1 Tax=Evansella sp. AB-rgal1 TaxID=3242696 RepID=UPI00359D94CB
METIFELFQGNPLLLFFVIAAIISFLQGLGGKKKQDPRGPVNQRPQQTKEQDEVDWRDIFRQEQQEEQYPQTQQQQSSYQRSEPEHKETYTASIHIDSDLEKANSELQDRYAEMKERKERAARMEQKLNYQSPILNGDITRSNKALDFRNISGDEVIKGIVWSEVLGKPKSKR